MLPIHLWVWAIHWRYRGHILKGNCLSLSEAKLSAGWHFKSMFRCFLPNEGKKVLRIKHYVSRENLLSSYRSSWAWVVHKAAMVTSRSASPTQFWSIQGYIVRPCLKETNKTKHKRDFEISEIFDIICSFIIVRKQHQINNIFTHPAISSLPPSVSPLVVQGLQR